MVEGHHLALLFDQRRSCLVCQVEDSRHMRAQFCVVLSDDEAVVGYSNKVYLYVSLNVSAMDTKQ